MARVFSGVQPSGEMHVGNYLGAFRQWVELQDEFDSFFCVVDLHALTSGGDSATLSGRTLGAAANLLAAGLDPKKCSIFIQSHVPEHAELAWLLECTATVGELRRMTQFKDKGSGQESVRVGLFTYPVLMAADILLYDADRVPVGDDQRQHLELTRDVATRFNHHYGLTFTIPEPVVPKVAARVMDLTDPTAKMSKSTASESGIIYVNDAPEAIARKVRRAVTDNEAAVAYDPKAKPGVSNLLELLGATSGSDPAELAGHYENYGSLKSDVVEAVVEMLRPVRQRYAELMDDPAYLDETVQAGAERARHEASLVLNRARSAVGLLSRAPRNKVKPEVSPLSGITPPA